LGDKSATEWDISLEVSVYERTVDALSAMWHYNESESLLVRAWFSVGTFSSGQDIAKREEVSISSTFSSFLANSEVIPDITGEIFWDILFIVLFNSPYSKANVRGSLKNTWTFVITIYLIS
jgi:hypothetical protein